MCRDDGDNECGKGDTEDENNEGDRGDGDDDEIPELLKPWRVIEVWYRMNDSPVRTV